jgi:hypothetical protein
MECQMLIDEVYDAMSNIHDMDTSLTDFAKAAVECMAPRMDALTEALEALRADLDVIDGISLGEVSRFLDAMARKIDAALRASQGDA